MDACVSASCLKAAPDHLASRAWTNPDAVTADVHAQPRHKQRQASAPLEVKRFEGIGPSQWDAADAGDKCRIDGNTAYYAHSCQSVAGVRGSGLSQWDAVEAGSGS